MHDNGKAAWMVGLLILGWLAAVSLIGVAVVIVKAIV